MSVLIVAPEMSSGHDEAEKSFEVWQRRLSKKEKN
jgi:hypothetical protein